MARAARMFQFPFEPYPVQQELMEQIYDVCIDGGVAVFESPTGTGKSLSVICSALQWRSDEEAARKQALDQEAATGSAGQDDADEEPDWLRDWGSAKAQEAQASSVSRLEEAQARLQGRLQRARTGDHGAIARKRARVILKAKSSTAGAAADRVNGSDKTTTTTTAAAGAVDLEDAACLVAEYFSDPEEAQRHNRKFATEDSDNSDDEPLGRKFAKNASATSSSSISAIGGSSGGTISTSTSVNGASGTATNGQSEAEVLKEDDAQLRALPKVIFCSRTHSQLAQFVREVRKTAFKNARVVSLGSRKNLCIHPDVKKLGSESRINDACLDLKEKSKKSKVPLVLDSAAVTAQTGTEATANGSIKKRKKEPKKASSTKGCPFHGFEVTQSLADQSLAKVMDIEELVGVAVTQDACAYYGSRTAAPLAELIVMPYTSLLHKETRDSLGIELKGNVVVLDEAHNIIETINSVHSARVTSEQVHDAQRALSAYLDRYRRRLKGKNLVYVKQILHVLKQLHRFFNQHEQKTAASTEQPSSNASGSNNFSGSSSTRDNNSSSANSSKSSTNSSKVQKKIFTINGLLFELRIDNLNLLKLERYLELSELSRKLLGFMHVQQQASMAAAASQPPTASSSSSTSKTSSAPADAARAAARGDAAAGAQSESASAHVSPLALVHRFLMSLMHPDKDGRVVLEKHPPHAAGGVTAAPLWSLKFVMLNPASHFLKMASEAKAVILLGGTMQPFDYIQQQLGVCGNNAAVDNKKESTQSALPLTVPANGPVSNAVAALAANSLAQNGPGKTAAPPSPSQRSAGIGFRTFACGHVIPATSILPLSVAKGPTGVDMDFTFKSRGTTEQMDELGRLLVNVCSAVPKGVVCFLPSYDYEKTLVAHWTRTGALCRLQGKKAVFREPRAASEVDATLAAYSKAIDESSAGALLLSVVGAKMSEGINFSDDLARCVVMVGLPYPDRTDPELIQKMAYLDEQRSGSGSEYYENLCMRAVNQSIGRSIRHIGDYAAVMLVDQRYAKKRSVVGKLPPWIAERVQHAEVFGHAIRHIRTFFCARHINSS